MNPPWVPAVHDRERRGVLDSGPDSANVTLTRMDRVFHRLIAHSIRRHTVVAVVIGLLAVCVWSVVPAPAVETGCQGFGHEPRMCGQAVGPDQIAVATVVAPAAHWEPVPTTSAAPQQVVVAVSEFQADPSAPRAPPHS